MIENKQFIAMSSDSEPMDNYDNHRCTICEKVLESRKLAIEHIARNHSDMAEKHVNILKFLKQDFQNEQETL